MTTTTPVRSVAVRPASALDDADHPFEARLLHILAQVDDLSSGSDELEVACADWHDRHHLSSARANVMRALTLPVDAVVLELGACGGAVTRYLGETFAVVDAVEPDPALAAVASRRCADLASVVVHAGWIDEVIAESSYDVIVALDVLGELEARNTDITTFVAQCASLLSPRGVLVIGADNVDGVRFLAGDITPRLHPRRTHRPPSAGRDELERAVRQAGLTPTTLSAFPDHRSTRTVFEHDELAALDPTLLTELPNFPSPAYGGPRLTPFPERRLWTEAVAAGRGSTSSNGLVVLASASAVVPDSVATYWSMGRRAAFSTTNQIMTDGNAAVVKRSLTFPQSPRVESPLQIRPHTEPLLHGKPMTHALADCGDIEKIAGLLRSWSALVDQSTVDGEPLAWDLIPRNILVLETGELRAFDQEWTLDPTADGADLIRSRGSFWLAHDLLFRIGRPDWLLGATVVEAAEFLLRLAHPTAPFDWHRTFLEQEPTHMSYVWPTTPRHSQPIAVRRERNNVSSLSNATPPDTPKATTGPDASPALREVVESLAAANADLRAENEALRLEQRHIVLVHRDHTVGLVAAAEALKDRMARAHQENRRQKARANSLEKQLTATKESASWRIGSRIVRPFAAMTRKLRR